MYILSFGIWDLFFLFSSRNHFFTEGSKSSRKEQNFQIKI